MVRLANDAKFVLWQYKVKGDMDRVAIEGEGVGFVWKQIFLVKRKMTLYSID